MLHNLAKVMDEVQRIYCDVNSLVSGKIDPLEDPQNNVLNYKRSDTGKIRYVRLGY